MTKSSRSANRGSSEQLDLIVKSSALTDHAVVLDLKDFERAIAWIENRISHVLRAGLHAYWTGQSAVYGSR